MLSPAWAQTSPQVAGPSSTSTPRKYHLSISPDALDADPELLEIIRRAGVTDIWLTGFLYGYWYYELDKTLLWKERAAKHGLAAHIINVPIGHPGDSLGSMSGKVPVTPPSHWKAAAASNGTTYVGTSLHAPATEENCDAMRKIQAAGVKHVFLDDDFRLARGPGVIGGCFCNEHKQAFLKRTGFSESQWAELLDAVAHRKLTPVLRAWVDFTCDQLTECFHAQQKAAPDVQLGNMIMYFGAEKAGIRLADYRDVPFRVGEMMFNDAAFGTIKGKTDELFSCLFHRRYARPELAFSETTAYPANQLSAKNMAAKLVVSTICDVHNTMYMSGVTAFPREHWQTLGPAMKRQAELHAVVAGHTAKGPLKHLWGEHSRYVGDDNPYSLFLALGIPFEVVQEPAADGITFLSDADALAADGLPSTGTAFVGRPQAGLPGKVRALPEAMPELLALKRELIPKLGKTPYVEGDTPVVCAWYPTARAVLLWNLSERNEDVTLRFGETRRPVTINALDAALIRDIG
jgi:hypothetical protein